MTGKIKSFEPLKGCGIIVTLTGEELPVQSENVNMSGVVVLNKNDIVEYEVETDDNGQEQAVNVSLIYKVEYAVKLSKLTFKDFGLDIKNNILNPPKCETHDEYCLMKFTTPEKLQENVGLEVCESGKYPCGIAVLKKDRTVVVAYSHHKKPTELCNFKVYGIKGEATKEEQYLSVGELLIKTYGLEHYGIMVELEDDFYQTIME